MKLLIKIPTRERGCKFFERYIDLMTYKNTHFLISLDDDDVQNVKEWKDTWGGYDNIKIVVGKSDGKVHAINRDLEGEDFDVLAIGSDDMRPEFKGYDSFIMEQFQNGTDWYLWSYDGHQNRICTVPIMGRDYYNRFGYVYNPIYKSLFCDNEQTLVAMQLHRVKRLMKKTIFYHQHPTFKAGDSLPYDSLYKRNDKYYNSDQKIFNSRKQQRFA